MEAGQRLRTDDAMRPTDSSEGRMEYARKKKNYLMRSKILKIGM